MDRHLVENRDAIYSSYGSPQSSGAYAKFLCEVIAFFHHCGFFKTVSYSFIVYFMFKSF